MGIERKNTRTITGTASLMWSTVRFQIICVFDEIQDVLSQLLAGLLIKHTHNATAGIHDHIPAILADDLEIASGGLQEVLHELVGRV